MNWERTARPRNAAVWLATALLGWGGCGVDPTDPIPQGAEIPEPAPVVVTVRFQDFTLDDAVDVEFYATNAAVSVLPDDLFVPENRITAGVGVAGTGIIQPLSADTIEFPCTESTTIGTLGGSFIDNESGEPRGVGTPRWAQDRSLGLCGATVTISFSGGNGEYATNIGIVFAPQAEP